MSALNSAVKRKLLIHNPAANVELPIARRPKAVVWTEERIAAWRRTGVRPRVAVWTPEQTGTFLDAAAHHRLYPIYHLIAYRGLRRGEAVGLRWEDVDVVGRQLVVAQQVVQLGWATEIGASKTDSGTRVVPLDAGTLALLKAWRRAQQVEAEAWGSAWQHTGGVHPRGREPAAPRPRHRHLSAHRCGRRTATDPPARPAAHRRQPGPPGRRSHEGGAGATRAQLDGDHCRHLHERPARRGACRRGSRRRRRPETLQSGGTRGQERHIGDVVSSPTLWRAPCARKATQSRRKTRSERVRRQGLEPRTR
jgi:integrase